MARSQNTLKNTGRTHFKKGKSGNPGGRPKGLAALVREQTKDGKELVTLHLEIMRGKLKQTRYTADGEEYEAAPSIADRLKAAEWLADRGWGKCESTMTVQNPDGSHVIPQAIIDAAARLAKTL